MSFDSILKNIQKVWPEDRIEKSKERLLKIWNTETEH